MYGINVAINSFNSKNTYKFWSITFFVHLVFGFFKGELVNQFNYTYLNVRIVRSFYALLVYIISVDYLSTFDEGMDKDEKEIRSFANSLLFFDTYCFSISFIHHSEKCYLLLFR